MVRRIGSEGVAVDLKQATQELFDESFWFRGTRQRRAIEYLGGCAELESLAVLVEALGKDHRRSSDIRHVLLRLTPPQDQAKIDRLWRLWFEQRHKKLQDVLGTLGCPAQDSDLQFAIAWKLGHTIALPPEQ